MLRKISLGGLWGWFGAWLWGCPRDGSHGCGSGLGVIWGWFGDGFVMEGW